MILDRLIRLASRLEKVPTGSPAADLAIHEALGRTGVVSLYTTDKEAAAELLPPGFEWMVNTYAARAVYASCRRSGMDGARHHPHHGQWGQTLPLAMCGAALRASAMVGRD